MQQTSGTDKGEAVNQPRAADRRENLDQRFNAVDNSEASLAGYPVYKY